MVENLVPVEGIGNPTNSQSIQVIDLAEYISYLCLVQCARFGTATGTTLLDGRGRRQERINVYKFAFRTARINSDVSPKLGIESRLFDSSYCMRGTQ